jgi:MtN3 and saliva related transmembrane protein
MFFPLLGQAAISSSDLMISMIGVAAAVLTTSSFLPQIIKAYRTKSMEDVSRYLMSFFATGTVLWMVYGIFKADLVIIGANATATAFNVILLYMKFAYRKKPAKIA